MNSSSKKCSDMIKCPICKKMFLHNPQSIYKISSGSKVKRYCSYTCWRKAGGDSGKPSRR